MELSIEMQNQVNRALCQDAQAPHSLIGSKFVFSTPRLQISHPGSMVAPGPAQVPWARNVKQKFPPWLHSAPIFRALMAELGPSPSRRRTWTLSRR